MALPKNLIRPLPVQDHKSERFQRPALPFASARRCSGWSKLQRWRTSEERQNPNPIRFVFGRGRRVSYIEEPTTSRRDRFREIRKPIRIPYLSRLKGQVAKNKNSKRKQRPRKARDWISADHSRIRRAPAYFATPRHARPGPARRGERARACGAPLLSPHT